MGGTLTTPFPGALLKCRRNFLNTLAYCGTAIKDSFESIDFRLKLIGFGADGASVNQGDKEGAIFTLRKEIPWIIFNWCLSHSWN